ncbi:uncharacterized protein LOC126737219 [Anthonomus grandis grandis]|uniref:uncharacterized protein LOC126737219 n=1 Tax=Anthonomus grandis grandis TaxID=2921223 RepID=UPI0021655350|nr:uncharacterized protein LOC126737219 [Anthonomus grandis grandis]
MDFQLVVAFVAFVIGFTQVLSQNSTNLLCYDCDPRTNNASCQNPVLNAVTHTNCHDKLKDRHVNSTLLCVSAFITFTGSQSNDTGIYRGCYAQDPSVTDICDWLKEETNDNNGLLTDCIACNTTRCNGEMFTSVTTGGTSRTIGIPLTAVFASILFHFLPQLCKNYF